jgi:tRNA(fMet)-specific endonuclease VapC
MADYLFDTTVFSYVFKDSPLKAPYIAYLSPEHNQYISFATEAELWYGARKADWGERRQSKLDQAIRRYTVLPYAQPMARLFADILLRFQSAGFEVSTNDAWIATTAVAYDLVLVTHDNDFLHTEIPGLSVIGHSR